MARAPIDFAITYDDARLRRMAYAQMPKALENAIEFTALALWQGIGEEAPTRHGRLGGSWRVRKVGKMNWTLGSNVLYRWYVNDGTKPHVIRAKRGKALAFSFQVGTSLGGKAVYASQTKRGQSLRAAGKFGRGTTTTRRGSAMVYRQSVNHPGTAPNPYIDRAIARVRLTSPAIVSKAIKAATAAGGT